MLLISEQQSTYPLAFLLSSGGKKTCENLARVVNKSGDSVIRLLENHAVTSDQSKRVKQKMLNPERALNPIRKTLISPSNILLSAPDQILHHFGVIHV